MRVSRSLDKNWSLEFRVWSLEIGVWRLEFGSLEFGGNVAQTQSKQLFFSVGKIIRPEIISWRNIYRFYLHIILQSFLALFSMFFLCWMTYLTLLVYIRRHYGVKKFQNVWHFWWIPGRSKFFGVWSLEIGVWSLEIGVWSLGLAVWQTFLLGHPSPTHKRIFCKITQVYLPKKL